MFYKLFLCYKKFNLKINILIYYQKFLIFLIIGGCGYILEGSNPLLPDEANTIAILPIQNQTFIAGLETDLSEQINRLLRSNNSVKIVPYGIADLQLSITLKNIQTNVSELSEEQISSGIKATIKGKLILIDRRINKNVWDNSIISANLTESIENEMETSSGISISRRTRRVIKLLATKIYDRLFKTF